MECDDELFGRFRATRDPAALAEVFDRTAPHLLGIARHLCGDAALAEDLVQDVFLAAIERAASWDERRGLFPWLVGILTNHARLAKRRMGRVPDPLALRADRPHDAAREAERRELERSVERAIEALPEAYRPVLRMHLGLGLAAKEIAKALGRPAGTVRAQVSRGLELVRKALPAGIGGAALAATGTRGLQAVRDAVLQGIAPVAAAGRLAVLLGGVLAMKKLVAVLAALLVALGAFATRAAWWPARSEAEAGGREASAATAGLAERQLAASAPGTRTAVAPQSAPSAPLARVRLRCVAAESGAPLAGCTVSLDARASSDTPRGPASKDAAWKTEERTTSTDGTFDVAFDPPRACKFDLHVRVSGRVPVHRELGDPFHGLPPGSDVDLGDLALATGTVVRGRITDRQGAPVAGLSLHLERTPSRDYPPYGRSRADGSFELAPAVSPGLWNAEVWPDTLLARPAPVTIAAGEPSAWIEVVVIRLDELEALAGTLVDEQGEPIPKVYVELRPGTAPVTSNARTDAAGRFRFHRRPEAPVTPLTLAVSAHGDFDAVDDPRALAWGASQVVLVQRRAPPPLVLDVRVVDAESGEPVEGFGVRCALAAAPGRPAGNLELREAGTHAGGTATIPRLQRGKNVLLVEPLDRERWCAAPPLELEVGAAGAPAQVVRLPRRATRAVEVVCREVGGSAPVAGTRVQAVVALDGGEVTAASYVRDRLELLRGAVGQHVALVAEARTDASGRCVLSGPSGTSFTLRVLGPGHVPSVLPQVAFAGETLRVEVDPGATLRGRVAPAGVLTALWPPEGEVESRIGSRTPGFLLYQGEMLVARKFPAQWNERARIERDGTFCIRGIEPGDWRLVLQHWVIQPDGTSVCQSPLLERIVGLRAGETRDLVLDIGALALGELRGTVVVDGKPYAGASIGLAGARVDTAGREIGMHASPVDADGSGRFRVRLTSGKWSVSVAFGNGAINLPAALVRGGEVSEVVWRVEHKVLRGRLLGADGNPRADREVSVRGEANSTAVRTAADGGFVLDPAFPERMTFRVWPPHLLTQEQRQAFVYAGHSWDEVNTLPIVVGVVDMPADRREHEVVLRVP